MIVLDASVIIAFLESTDAHHPRASRLMLDLADESLGASPITLAEVMVGPARAGLLSVVEGALRDLEVQTVALTPDDPPRLAVLRAQTRLRMPDCCVLVAAQSVGGSVATFDDKLASAARALGIELV